MSTSTAIQQSASPSALRRLVARHPVAAFLIMAYTITSLLALPPIRTRLGAFLLNFELWDSFSSIFGVALPAFLVIAAMLGLLVFEALWIVAILGALALGLGLALAGYSLWLHKENMVLQPAG